MSRGGALESIHAIESCAFHLLSWRPFAQTLDSDSSSKPRYGPCTKRPCRSDRATSSFSIDAILDMSKLTLFDDDRALSFSAARKRWFSGKRRRRRGSISGRSSDRRAGCSVAASAANGTCSDFPMLATDSSGELFGDPNWASDVSDRNSRREREASGVGGGERDNLGGGCGQFGNCDSQGNESGYGSEPGYRGDAELGDGDEEDDDSRVLFWGDEFGADSASPLERVGENSLQKAHHRGRRKKHDVRMA